ncbi:hypothetical protein [Rhizobium sp. YTU87027]|uniref:hypothetical protein n=1 Tax=Rhizobium sp. YTU87027 TaxID=3417741 RepID=UPI003D68F4EF
MASRVQGGISFGDFQAINQARPSAQKKAAQCVSKDNTASTVWAVTAYRSKTNEECLRGNGLKTDIHQKKPKGKPMPEAMSRQWLPLEGFALPSSMSLPIQASMPAIYVFLMM